MTALLFLFALSAFLFFCAAGMVCMPMFVFDAHRISNPNTPGAKPSRLHCISAAVPRTTELRTPLPTDHERANQIFRDIQAAAIPYCDLDAARRDGYRESSRDAGGLHVFTNHWYAFEAAFHFNPQHPSSLIYECKGETARLVAVIFTAPKSFTSDQLDARIPLSHVRWQTPIGSCAGWGCRVDLV